MTHSLRFTRFRFTRGWKHLVLWVHFWGYDSFVGTDHKLCGYNQVVLWVPRGPAMAAAGASPYELYAAMSFQRMMRLCGPAP